MIPEPVKQPTVTRLPPGPRVHSLTYDAHQFAYEHTLLTFSSALGGRIPPKTVEAFS